MARAQVSTAPAVLKTRFGFRLQRLKRTAFTLNLESQLLFIRYNHISNRRTAHLTLLHLFIGAVRGWGLTEFSIDCSYAAVNRSHAGRNPPPAMPPGRKCRGFTLETANPQAWKLFILTRKSTWAEFLRFVYDFRFCCGLSPSNAIRRRSPPTHPHRALPGFCLEGRSVTRRESPLRPTQPRRVRTGRPRPAPC